MSASKRRHLNVVEEECSESDTDVSSDEEGIKPNPDEYIGNEEVEIEFEGRAPLDPDCHGISQMLQRVFLKPYINCMHMADLIIGQNFVGSVICQCEPDCIESDVEDDMYEDDTIFGITTVLNITAKKNVPCIEQFRSFIVQKAEKHADGAVLTYFRDALGNESRPIGYIINERFVNIPAQISVPLLENLYKEITTAKQKGMPYNFVYFMMVIKFYRKKAKKGKPEEDTYTNPEEELFVNKAVSSFEFSVAGECDIGLSGDWLDADAALTPYRKVILFDAKNLPQLILDIKKYINGQ